MPEAARNCSSFFRSAAATARVQAACTTGTRSTGTTNTVRRMPSIRISERCSYIAFSIVSTCTPGSRAQLPR
jgi:hypothetical protein